MTTLLDGGIAPKSVNDNTSAANRIINTPGDGPLLIHLTGYNNTDNTNLKFEAWTGANATGTRLYHSYRGSNSSTTSTVSSTSNYQPYIMYYGMGSGYAEPWNYWMRLSKYTTTTWTSRASVSSYGSYHSSSGWKQNLSTETTITSNNNVESLKVYAGSGTIHCKARVYQNLSRDIS